jgi:putative endonuclease
VRRHYVYLLACADGTFYAGYTTDPERRLLQHNSGKASKYTRGRLPVRLCYTEEVPSKGEALRRELAIKQLRRESKQAMCSGYPKPRAHSSR